jgi:hypothetical protein
VNRKKIFCCVSSDSDPVCGRSPVAARSTPYAGAGNGMTEVEAIEGMEGNGGMEARLFEPIEGGIPPPRVGTDENDGDIASEAEAAGKDDNGV